MIERAESSFKQSASKQFLKVDFKLVSDAALSAIRTILPAYLPGGKYEANEYVVENPTRADKSPGSFKVNTKTGKWSDFACGDGGADLIDLIKYLKNLNNLDAAKELARFLGIEFTEPPENIVVLPAAAKVESKGMETALILAAPIGTPAPTAHPKHGRPALVWIYHNENGLAIRCACRFEVAGGGKTFANATWQGGRWQWKDTPEPRPLYGLDRLAKYPDAIVVICEGEKAADAARLLLPEPGFVCITSPNGANSAGKADWSPLKNRRAFMWPDLDGAGQKYATAVELALSELNCSVTRLQMDALFEIFPEHLNANLPDGFDAADTVAAGVPPFTAAQIKRLWPNDAGEPAPSATTNFIENRGASADFLAKVTRHRASQENSAELDAAIFGDPPEQFALLDWDKAKKFHLGGAGVYHRAVDKEGLFNGAKWLCSSLRVIALTRNAQGLAWGRYLEVTDREKVKHFWAMPADLLKGDGSEMRGELLSMGLDLAPGARNRDLLSTYVITDKVKAFARCVDKIGWHGKIYVLPGQILGDQSDEIIVFQGGTQVAAEFESAGDFVEWKKCSALAVGNSRIILALSLAFAPTLLEMTNSEGGGVHFRGTSSCGKSTAQLLAASAWGPPKQFAKSWRGTSNGLEVTALSRHDNLLILDELHQSNPQETGDVAYLLANGQTKLRMSKTGTAREAKNFQLLSLSTGEISLSNHISSAGKQGFAGQDVRMLDIAADAGCGFGIYETTHGRSGGELTDEIKDICMANYGHAGVAFVKALIAADKTTIRAKVSEMVAFLTAELSESVGGQVERALKRFALIAAAGELACQFGIVDWRKNDAANAALTCLKSWIDGRGGVENGEKAALIAQVRGFIEAHGDSRFQSVDPDESIKRVIVNRAGFWRRNENDNREYLVFPEQFKTSLCKGFDSKLAATWLKESGLLKNQKTIVVRIPNNGTHRFYILTVDEREPETAKKPKPVIIEGEL